MSSTVARRDRTKRPRRTSIEELDETETAIVAALAKNFGPPVYVFGSRARGNWAADSDIDVGLGGGFNRGLHRRVIDNITKLHGIKIDAVSIANARTHKGFEAWA